MKKLFLFICLSCFCVSLCGQETYFFKGKNGKYGLVKTINRFEREVIVKPKYDSCTNFLGFGHHTAAAEVKLKNKWGYLDIYGKEITPIKYDLCRGFHCGFATVKLNGKWGIIDKTGTEIIPVKYDKEIDFEYGNYIVVESNERQGVIDTAGNEVLPTQYDRCCIINKDLTIVELNGKEFLIKNSTKEVLPLQFKGENMYSSGSTHSVKIFRDNVLYFLDNTSYEVIAAIRLDDYQYYHSTVYHHFSDDCIAIKTGGKWEIIDNTGAKIADCKYKKRTACENCAAITYEHEKVAAKKTKKSYKCYVQKR